MVKSSRNHLVPETPQVELPALLPKQPYLAAVRDLSQRLSGVEALFDAFGRVRTLTSSAASGLFDRPFAGDVKAHAGQFVNAKETVKALGLQHAELVQTTSNAIPGLGQVVEFRQMLTVDGEKLRVRGGFVHVYVDAEGHIFQVNNTVRHGRKPTSLDNIVSEAEAIAEARKTLGVDSCAAERAELVISAHNDRLDPVFEVTLTTHDPRKVVTVLVKATTGEVVNVSNRLHTGSGKKSFRARRNPRRRPRPQPTLPPLTTNNPVLGKVLLAIPDPNTTISKQAHDMLLEALPDPKVLKNSNLVVYMGSQRREVRAKADGTFLYNTNEREFQAVVTFYAFHFQMELFKSWGMKAPEKPIPVFVDDASVRDNAYFDPESYEIHLGVGSGLPNGLNRYIALDLGVTWHENGHHVVFLQTPGQDLPGSEGGAIHESVGDICDLLMDFWFRLKFADKLGATLGVAEVEADRRVIGKYALPPDGIRIQKNTKKTPKDKTGEPHDDGLISGGAKADLLVAMVKASGDVEKALVDFGKLTLAALALVPSHKVTFVDLLRSYITADAKLFAGANKSLITRAFADHGIVLKTGGKIGGTPVIIIR